MALPHLPDKYLTVNELRLRYWTAGTGRPTLFLHALNPTAGVESWLKDVDAYTAAGCQMFALDMPGWGLSEQPKNGQYHFTLWTEAVKGFCEALGLEQVDIVGQTMGGWVAAVFAHQYPHRVRRMVLLNNAGLNPSPPRSYSDLASMPMRTTLESLRQSYKDEVVAQQVYDRLHLPGREEGWKKLLGYVTNAQVREEWGLRTRLPQTRTPMLFAMRDNDGEMATRYAIEGFNLAPVAMLLVIKGVESTDAVNSELRRGAISFLTAMDPVPAPA